MESDKTIEVTLESRIISHFSSPFSNFRKRITEKHHILTVPVRLGMAAHRSNQWNRRYGSKRVSQVLGLAPCGRNWATSTSVLTSNNQGMKRRIHKDLPYSAIDDDKVFSRIFGSFLQKEVYKTDLWGMLAPVGPNEWVPRDILWVKAAFLREQRKHFSYKTANLSSLGKQPQWILH